MVSLKRRRVSWRGYLFLAVSVAVVVVTPWHRARWSDFLVYVLAAVLVCGPLFAWLLLAHERRAATVVSVIQLAVLAGHYSASQWLLSGPVRPPVADWALFTAPATGMICLLGAVHQRRHLRWPRVAGACTLALASWLTAAATFAVAFGDGAKPSAKVEPYLSEIDPGWGYRVTEPQFDGGSGGVYFLTATVTGKDELYLRDLGWNAECEPVGGLLARLKVMDWGAHCLTIIGSTVQVEVRTGHLPGPPLSILCCRQEPPR